LPGGQAVLAANPSMGGSLVLAPVSTGEPQELTLGVAPQFVSSGHIVFLRGTSLWAIPFDLDRLEVAGSAVQVLEGVVERGVLPNYALSPSGSLVYVPTFSYGRPEVLFEGDYDTHRARNYDVAADGRFLMVKDGTPPDRASAREHLVLVQNWIEELKRLVPTDN